LKYFDKIFQSQSCLIYFTLGLFTHHNFIVTFALCCWTPQVLTLRY